MSATIKAGACAKMVTLPLAWVPGRQVAPGVSATRARVRLCTVFVTQFTSDRCLELIMWLELTRKRDQHDERLPDHLPVKQSQAWCRFGTVIGQNMERSPASEPSRP